MYAVLPSQSAILGVSLTAVGLLLGANRIIRIPGNLLAGALNDRLGHRPLFLLGMLLGMVSTASYALSHGFWPLLGGRLLWGIAWALINVGGYTMILDYSTGADRGRMTGLYHLAFALGLAISPVLGGTLTDALGFRSALWVCAAVTGFGLLVALLALPETRSTGRRTETVAKKLSPRKWVGQMVATFRTMDRRIVRAGYVYFVAFFVNGGVLMSTVGLYVAQRWGDSITVGGAVLGVASVSGIMLSLRAILGMLAGPIAGIASDRLGNRWPVARWSLLLAMAGFTVLAVASQLWAIPVGVALVAAGAGALLTAVAALVGDLADRARPGLTMGALATSGDLGSATGPLVAYALAPVWGLGALYLLSAALLASALVATIGQAATVRRTGE
jgi:MFS family permease